MTLEILAAFERAGRNVSDMPSSAYAPTIFSGDSKAKGVSKKRLEEAMKRLFSADRIHVEVSEPPSKQRRRIVARQAMDGHL